MVGLEHGIWFALSFLLLCIYESVPWWILQPGGTCKTLQWFLKHFFTIVFRTYPKLLLRFFWVPSNLSNFFPLKHSKSRAGCHSHNLTFCINITRQSLEAILKATALNETTWVLRDSCVHVDMVTATMASSLYKLLWDSIDGIHEQQGYTQAVNSFSGEDFPPWPLFNVHPSMWWLEELFCGHCTDNSKWWWTLTAGSSSLNTCMG